jgi:uncharacterized delta-60 repeat protein
MNTQINTKYWAKAAAAISFATLALAGGIATAAPTDPDPTFGEQGGTRIDAGAYEEVRDIVRQPDGKIVGVGSASKTIDALVFRLLPDGTPDTTFSDDGVRTIDGGLFESGEAVAVQPDGKIVIVGTAHSKSGSDAAVYRLNPDGSYDNSFDGDGARGIDSGGVEFGTDVALQTDGKIVVVGLTRNNTGSASDAAVYRLNPNGSYDNSFDGDGARGIDSGGVEEASSVAIQPDGKIVVGGSANGIRLGALYRLNPNGSLDGTFDGDGAVGIDGEQTTYIADVAVAPDGGIVAAGSANNGNAVVVKVNAGGQPVAAFGTNGVRSIDAGGEDFLDAVAIQADGKIVASGQTSVGSDGLVARLTAGGAPDRTFAPNGVDAVGGSGLIDAKGLALLPDGRMLLAGHNNASDGLVLQIGDAPVDPAAPTCAGKEATIVGTDGKDRLRGTKGADVITALGGKDVVKGLAGNDRLCGGDGKDRLMGGEGKDRIFGESGKDRIAGGPGRDKERQ